MVGDHSSAGRESLQSLTFGDHLDVPCFTSICLLCFSNSLRLVLVVRFTDEETSLLPVGFLLKVM